MLSKLQIAHPHGYPDELLRTVQRRLKIWRAAIARELVFGADHGAADMMAPDALRDVEASSAGGHQGRTKDLPLGNGLGEEHLAEAIA